jgi:hypothetical protein
MITARHALLSGLFLLAQLATAQVSIPMSEYRATGSMLALDSLYTPAVDGDSTRSAFPTQQDLFVEQYQAMVNALGKYLYAHDWNIEQPARTFNKFYFDADGRMTKYIYDLKGELSEEQRTQFRTLADAFFVDHRFPLKATTPFRQCGPSTFMPTKH